MAKKIKFVEPPRCENCGGIHFGGAPGKCPYVKAPCVVCKTMTIYACSDCAIDSGGTARVHVCDNVKCQRKHEKLHPNSEPQDLMTDTVHP